MFVSHITLFLGGRGVLLFPSVKSSLEGLCVLSDNFFDSDFLYNLGNYYILDTKNILNGLYST